MAGRRSTLTNPDSLSGSVNADPLRELFEACKTGDLARVKALVTPKTVNARDTAGRKSTPLHFAAGKLHYSNSFLSLKKLRGQIAIRRDRPRERCLNVSS